MFETAIVHSMCWLALNFSFVCTHCIFLRNLIVSMCWCIVLFHYRIKSRRQIYDIYYKKYYTLSISLQNMWCKITKINDITKQHQNLYAFSYVYSISYSCVYFLFLCLCPIYSVNDICLQYLKNAQRYQF